MCESVIQSDKLESDARVVSWKCTVIGCCEILVHSSGPGQTSGPFCGAGFGLAAGGGPGAAAAACVRAAKREEPYSRTARGHADLVPIAYALHRRTLGTAPFVVCNQRRFNVDENVRSRAIVRRRGSRQADRCRRRVSRSSGQTVGPTWARRSSPRRCTMRPWRASAPRRR
jgi:hypothetical protein